MSDVDTPSRDLALLAPNFRAAVEEAIRACINQGYLVKVNEAYRSQARQAWLYAQGRTRPGNKVTNAPTSLTSWHGYGLAVDVIHQTKAYWPFGKTAGAQNEKWFEEVAAIFKRHGCAWGGDWKHPDTPHMQWAPCPASPSDAARTLIRDKGVTAVWSLLKAG
jgi:peptidoglycan L-alanyl-D-glutamate endopeptidase CwlK